MVNDYTNEELQKKIEEMKLRAATALPSDRKLLELRARLYTITLEGRMKGQQPLI